MFNRSLLENIDYESILKLLEETEEVLSSSQEMGSDLKKALGCRLRFRAQFLRITEMADARTLTNIKDLWTDLLAALPDIKSSTHLGKAVPSSFSTKIQRKLASTVPPRPIVQVSQEAAFEHLERLCRDASVVVEVLKYYDSHSLMVRELYAMTSQANGRPRPLSYCFRLESPSRQSTSALCCNTTYSVTW
jgi:hypothetical protein